MLFRICAVLCNFNPRPPRGERLTEIADIQKPVIFQSTPSARRATRDLHDAGGTPQISIHALREEGDYSPLSSSNFATLFQSTPSARRATQQVNQRIAIGRISIHALREEGD